MRTKCEKCKELLEYNEVVDSFFCRACDEWKGDRCRDAACEFCSIRAKKPSLQKYE